MYTPMYTCINMHIHTIIICSIVGGYSVIAEHFPENSMHILLNPADAAYQVCIYIYIYIYIYTEVYIYEFDLYSSQSS
jgi:hypothetical protein